MELIGGGICASVPVLMLNNAGSGSSCDDQNVAREPPIPVSFHRCTFDALGISVVHTLGIHRIRSVDGSTSVVVATTPAAKKFSVGGTGCQMYRGSTFVFAAIEGIKVHAWRNLIGCGKNSSTKRAKSSRLCDAKTPDS